MNFTRRPCESRSPPQIFSNSSIGIFFVHAITEFFAINLFFFKLLNFLFLSCLPEASCSDWTMQRYGEFRFVPNIWANFGGSCCDGTALARQVWPKMLKIVAKKLAILEIYSYFRILKPLSLNINMNNHITEGYMPFMGYQTYYRIVGEASEKAPLLLLHGGPGSTHNYFEVLDCIADTGRQVISYDQIGCGNSYLDGHPELWTLQTWIDELIAIREYLHLETVHILGQSWGAMQAIAYAGGRAVQI